MSVQVINKLAETVMDASKRKGLDAFNSYSYFVLKSVSELDCDVITKKFTSLYEKIIKTGNGDFVDVLENIHNVYCQFFECVDGYNKSYVSLRGERMKVKEEFVTTKRLRTHVWQCFVDFDRSVDKPVMNSPQYQFVRKIALGINDGSLVDEDGKDLCTIYTILTAFASMFSFEEKRLAIYDNSEVVQDLCESLFVGLAQINEGSQFEEEMVQITNGDDEWLDSDDKTTVWDAFDAVMVNSIAMGKRVDRVGLVSATMRTMYNIITPEVSQCTDRNYDY